MWLEAVRDLKEDNRRQNHISHDEWNKDYPPGRNGDKGNFEVMSDIFCLFPCCCCCFCMCRKPKKKKWNVILYYSVMICWSPFYRTSYGIKHLFWTPNGTQTCSLIGNQTWTTYFWLLTNIHWTTNIIWTNAITLLQT